MDDRRALATYTYDIYLTDALPTEGLVRAERDRLASASLDARELAELTELDGILIESAIDGELLEDALEDDPARPLTDWWWHLGAIHSRTYPAALLPEHLRALYTESAAQGG